ncbi:MAG TPA: Uma2 family endonuclease [Tepidisphaeraceae bacterium]|nr:Uma2 family endonuclease [Tepidisphaeraceae bacterium]
MTTATTANILSSVDATPAVYGERGALLLDEVSWELYEQLLKETAHQNLRITYDEGRLFLMSPLPKHEKVKTLTGRMIELASLERGIPIASLGSTTWKRQELKKGLEADECYYMQHEKQVRALMDLDLSRDPPPDLAIEVYISYNPLNRPSVYSALRVPEIWRFRRDAYEFLLRSADGTYHSIPRSEALPFLTPADINRFVDKIGTTDETSLMLEFREWVRALQL